MKKLFCLKGGCEWLDGYLCSHSCPYAKMVDSQDLMALQQIKDSPCAKCPNDSRDQCSNKCFNWQEWAKESWRGLRSVFRK